MKFFLSFIVTLTWAPFALAWVTIPTNDPNILFEIDEKSISKQGDLLKFVEKLTYLKPHQADIVSGKIIYEKKVIRLIHCTQKTQGVLQGTLYGENSSLIESVTFAESKVSMQAIPAGTLAEAERELVCATAAATP